MASVAELVELVVKHGITRLVCGDVTIERPPPIPPAPKKEPTVVDEFERLKRMTPDEQDARLMLRKLP